MLGLLPLLLQTQSPQINFIQAIFDGVADNPSSVILAVSLIVFLLATKAMLSELRESRKMLNRSQESGDAQENKALDMATNAINKVDKVVESVNNMAEAMRESSKNYFASAQLSADAHVKTTNMLVDRITAMDRERAEAEMYSNGRLLTQVNDQLVQGQEHIAALVGTILADANTMHETTRRIVTDNHQLVLEALRATPPTVPQPTVPQQDKSQT